MFIQNFVVDRFRKLERVRLLGMCLSMQYALGDDTDLTKRCADSLVDWIEETHWWCHETYKWKVKEPAAAYRDGIHGDHVRLHHVRARTVADSLHRKAA